LKTGAEASERYITSLNSRRAKKTQKEVDEGSASILLAPQEKEQAGSSLHIKVPREDELVVPDRMPYIVIIIDELADLMQTAPADEENTIARITQMTTAAGHRLIVEKKTQLA